MLVYLTNLGAYNNGVLLGEWVDLSEITKKKLGNLFYRIGLVKDMSFTSLNEANPELVKNDLVSEEYFITDYEMSDDERKIFAPIDEWTTLSSLMKMQAEFDELDSEAVVKLIAYAEAEHQIHCLKELQEAEELIEDFDLLLGVTNEDQLAEWLEDAGYLDVPEHLQPYFDYEAYASDYADEYGTFTSVGFLFNY